jgi:hypothetical protein
MSNMAKVDLNGQIDNAVELSSKWYDTYIDAHIYGYKKFSADIVHRLAIARYEWLLSTARSKVLRRFSYEELYEVSISIQCELAIPSDYPLKNAVADDNHIVFQDYRSSRFGPLIDKLILLSPVEEMALRDILERYWYGAAMEGISFEVFLHKEQNSIASQSCGNFPS